MTLRIPEEVHAALRRLAEREYRPITDQILLILRRALVEAGELKDPPEKGGS